jgi:lysophospholipase L1-like esterase
MHHFPALPQPLRSVLGARAKQFNRALEDLLQSQADCQLLAFNLPMQADYIADDGFHPSAVTYGLWADVAAKAITPAE